MTAGRPKRRTTKEAASGGVISTAHGASWFLLCASLFYALQEDFLPTAATSRFAAVVAAVIGMLYLPTFGGQLFKLIKQKWLWCNDFFAGVTVLFGAMLFAWLWWASLAHAVPSVHARATGKELGITVEAQVDNRHKRRQCSPRLVGPALDAGLPAYTCLPSKLRDSTHKRFTLHGLETNVGFLVLRAGEAS